MPTSLIIVDDFLEKPESFRAAALKLDYPDLEGPFPGRNSQQRLALSGVADEVSRLTGERLTPLDPPRSHGKCRLTLARDARTAHVHVDPGYWSGILYLSRPEDCRGGTEFFRHLPTGTDGLPLTHEAMARMGYASMPELHQDIIERDGADRSKWELTSVAPMRFNRLVLLRPWLWHTAGPGFGDGIENGRLIHVLFFQPVAQDRPADQAGAVPAASSSG